MPLGTDPGSARTEQIDKIRAFIESRIPGAQGQQYAEQYGKFAAAHPKLSAQQAYVGWFLIASKLNKKLAVDLKDEVQALGGLLGDTTSALTSLNPLAGLFQANIWERVAMVGIGVILIAVGVAQLTHAVPIATKIAKVVK